MSMKKLKRFVSVALAAVLAITTIPTMPVTTKAAGKGYEERLTPIMGWSSWNEFANRIDEEIFVSNMDLMKEYGLIDVGYEYFNIDDGFQGGRDSKTGLVTHNKEKFPHGMKYIADYAHKLGMKAGIYTDIGCNTCASRANGEGNKEYHNKPGTGYGLGVGLYNKDKDSLRVEDLRQYFITWDYDFIKVDWCGGSDLGWKRPPESGKGVDMYYKAGEEIEKLRKEKGEDIIYNVCCWRFPGDKLTSDESGADSWRTGGDLWANFDSITGQLNNIKNRSKYSKPGKSNDLDMMQVGRGLTYEEDKSHFSMWCMAASPLMIGCDLRTITPEALGILKNEEMIAIDQDPACIGGTVAKELSYNDADKSKKVEIWTKDLGKKGSNTKAIAVLNRGNVAREVSVSWKELGFGDDVLVRDVWQHKYIDVDDTYKVTVPAHGTVVWKVTGDVEESGSAGEINGSVKVEYSDKASTMNLTDLGNADWMYYGKEGGVSFRRKANATDKLTYSGNMLGEVKDTDYYNDSATAYSWSDGDEQKSGSGVRQGLTIGKSVGSYGRIDAPSDYREHVLYVPVTGWRSNIKVDVLVDGKIAESKTFNEAKASDGQPRVNKLIKVTYSTKTNSTVSVKWSIVGQSQNNGNTAVEAAALYIDPNAEQPPSVYTASADMLEKEVDLAAKGTLDYVQFGGSNGAISSEKANTDLLKKFTTGSGATVESKETATTYIAGDEKSKKGAAQTKESSSFAVTLPASKEVTQADIYLGATDANVAIETTFGNGNIVRNDYITGDGTNKVYTLYYKSDSELKVEMKLASVTGDAPQMRLDAVTLAKCTKAVVFEPSVTQSGDTLTVSARVIRPDGAAAAKTMEIKVYDDNNNIKKTETASIEQTEDTTVTKAVNVSTGFSGKAEVCVLDASGKVIGNTFTFNLPLANRADNGYVGRFTAQRMVKNGALLVDVRAPEEFEKTGIEGAINIPLGDILTKGQGMLAAAGATKNSNIIVYCVTGKRSAQARETLLDMGYTNVYDLGGYEKWNSEPSVVFTDYQEVILSSTQLYITLSGVEHEDVKLKYSIGKKSTIKDAKDYTGPFKLSKSDRVKAYLVFGDEVVYEKYYDYLVFENTVPNVENMTGKYCSELKAKDSYAAWDKVKNDKSPKSGDIKIAGRTFKRGVSGHAPSYMVYDIPSGMNRFVAAAGCDDAVGNKSFTILYSIYVDGKLMDRTVRMTTGRFYVFDIRLPEGAKELKLEAKQGNSEMHKHTDMHSEWGIARFVKDNSEPPKEEVIVGKVGDVLEAEEAELTAGASISSSATCSKGKYVGNIGGSGKVSATLKVNAEKAGDYIVNVSYCAGEERKLKVEVNGKEYEVACPASAKKSWMTPVDKPAEVKVSLQKGENTIVLSGVGTAYAPNLDCIQILTDEEKQKLEAAKASLNALVEQMKEIVDAGQQDYTESSWNAFMEAYNAAKAVSETVTLSDVTALQNKLKAAKNALVKGDENPPISDDMTVIEKLQEAVAKAENLIEDDYTPESWAGFAAAYNAANEALANANTELTEEKAEQLLGDLTKAQDALVKKASNPGDTDEDTEEARAQARAALNTTISKVEATYNGDSSIYTEASWSVFAEAYAKAVSVTEDTTVAEIKVIKTELETAFANLTKKNNENTNPGDGPTTPGGGTVTPGDGTTGGNGTTGGSGTTGGNGTTGGSGTTGGNGTGGTDVGTGGTDVGTTNPISLTDAENRIAAGLGVAPEVAVQINKTAEKYGVSEDTLYITESYLKDVKDDDDVDGASFAALRAKAAKQTKNSIKISWNKVKGADGYLVFGNKCADGNAYKLLKKTKSTSYTQKKLKKGTAYKYIVLAYTEVSGTDVTLAASKTIHSITKGGSTGVAKTINVKPSKVTLRVGKTKKLITKEIKADKKIKAHRKINYESSNPAVATVNKNGKITAKKKGKCTIYVYAQNGVYKTVSVNVKK